MKRVRFLPRVVTGLMALLLAGQAQAEEPAVFQGNGVKIGEPTVDSVLIWTRLTRQPEPLRGGAAFLEVKIPRLERSNPQVQQIPAGKRLEEMQDALPGAPGEIRASWQPESGGEWQSTAWQRVDPARNFTRQLELTALTPATWYRVRVESRAPNATAGATIEGRFRTQTPPDRAAGVRFVVITCQDDTRRDDPEGFAAYPHITAWKPDFVVHTGDVLYLDKATPFAFTKPLARFKWDRTFAYPLVREFYRQTAVYFQKDDHDIHLNDCWPGMRYGELSWEDGIALNRENLPWPKIPYRTYRWGKDVQFWLLEGREFRSANTDPDGPAKTILGAEQKRWLRETLAKSDAAFRIIISPTPIVGPDLARKGDNHANPAFRHEGDELRALLASQPNTIVICGDRHWQYHSIDKQTGLQEFGCGPVCDKMTEGFVDETKELPLAPHLALHGGFLAVVASRENGRPSLSLEHHDASGRPVYRHTFSRSSP